MELINPLNPTSKEPVAPAQLLGIDGWVLRTLPKVARKTFLQGWLKLMMVVHHPDRFLEEKEKETHQKFLQAASEVVDYLMTDNVTFESAISDIPTKKNIVVQLEQKITQLSDRLEDEHQLRLTAERKAKTAEEANIQLQTKMGGLKLEVTHTHRAAARQTSNLKHVVNQSFKLTEGWKVKLMNGNIRFNLAHLNLANWKAGNSRLNERLGTHQVEANITTKEFEDMLSPIKEPLSWTQLTQNSVTRMVDMPSLAEVSDDDIKKMLPSDVDKLHNRNGKRYKVGEPYNKKLGMKLQGCLPWYNFYQVFRGVLDHHDVDSKALAAIAKQLNTPNIEQMAQIEKLIVPSVIPKSVLVFTRESLGFSFVEFFWYTGEFE